MKKESNKDLYCAPETDVLILSLEAPVAQSQTTEPIDDDPEEHDL